MTPVAGTRQRPRTCVGCREEAPKRALIRIVRTPEGTALLDERGKLPGRGAYLCACRGCLLKAQKSKALSRALKAEIPESFYDTVGEYIDDYQARSGGKDLAKELHSLLGLSRRAGLIYIGTDSVKSQCIKEPLLILSASDSSEAVEDILRKQVEGSEHKHFRVPLSVEQLSSALGAHGVQVIALPGRNGLADKIKMLLQEGGVALEQNESV